MGHDFSNAIQPIKKILNPTQPIKKNVNPTEPIKGFFNPTRGTRVGVGVEIFGGVGVVFSKLLRSGWLEVDLK